jgi:integration host factor subunit alpha
LVIYCIIKKGDKMVESTLTRMDLGEAVFREVGLSRYESSQLVESVLKIVSDALVEGQSVKISSFGTFSSRSKSSRIGRNPKTGKEAPIVARKVITFRPSHLMKERVNLGNK